MRVYLLECSASQWIPCAERLSENGIEISLWTAWQHLRRDIESGFPEAVFHDTRDAKIGHHALPLSPLYDDTCEAVWREQAAMLHEMIARFDHGRDIINIDTAVLCFRLLSYWRAVLEHRPPDLVIFSTPPHVVYDYIVLCLCEKLGIPTLMFEETTVLPPYSISMSHYRDGSERLSAAYADMLARKSVDVPEAVEALIARTQSSYADAIPPREAAMRETLSDYDDLAAFSARREAEIAALRAMENDPASGYRHAINTSSWIKQRGVEFRHSFTGHDAGSLFQRQRLDEQLLTLRRKTFYDSLTTSTDAIMAEDGPMVFFSMAGQPERTSCPQSGVFSNQFVAISLLAQGLPQGWRVVVKEHPNQFHPGMYVNMCRSESYYEVLAALPRTVLVATDAPQFDLLDRAEIVATTGGTVALEAVMREKPALVFGSPWYQACNGVHCVKDVSGAQDAIADIASVTAAPLDEVRRFFAAIPEGGFAGMADAPPPEFDIGDALSGANLADEILAHAQRLNAA